VRPGAGYAALTGLFLVYFYVDQAVLGTIGTQTDAGLYRAAYAFMSAAVQVPIALNTDLMRTRLFQTTDDDAFRRIARSGGARSAVAGVATVLAIELVARPVVRLAYRPDFDGSTPLLRILGLAMLPHFLSSWASNVLVAGRRLRWTTRVQVVLVLVNLVGNLALVPRYGAKGSAWMTVVTEAVAALAFVAALGALRPRPAARPGAAVSG
jgi:O-antigen/teichoic acid export membrane protein